ncbi:metallophosphoesterase family protein [Xanthobacter agilis]|uniref:DNA repair exonuclease SbcCD nuclease subunit n=1 Tax=Xanthobacter agilis TaxID=47492 RepID=A0ABU0LBX4_XANAG|nr:DNA repair exonuclease [Xanthobacter agilis]MDQ0504629.1 DNA repair exonuclease SbcCD nuclease subunit [Xanthobacter agilis]
MAPRSFQFLHAADLHLDSPLRGLARRGPEALAFADASRQALENLVSAALARKVAFLVIAGDIYDGDWKDFSTGHVFVRQMSRLAREGIRVFIVSGNHDAASVITSDLPLPRNVHRFPVDAVESVPLPELQVALHGRGFAQRHVARNLSLDYPAALPGHFNIGVLHTSLTGREGHEVYAPCTVADLERTGYDYWALGHIHQREVVAQRPAIVFPGNLQGRHARETGPKGATLVRVEDGRIVALEALTLDAARFDAVAVDLTGVSARDTLLEKVRSALSDAVDRADGRPLAARLTLTGVSPLASALRADPIQLHEDMVALAAEVSDALLIEKVSTRLEGPRPEAAPMLADFGQILAAVAADPQVRADIRDTLRKLHDKAPKPVLKALSQAREDAGDDAGDDLDTQLAAAIAEAEEAILARLADPDGTAS